MPLSGTTNYSVSRDDVITRALRLVGAIGQGEVPENQTLLEATQALNMIIKERQADGMQLWKVTTSSMSMTASTAAYAIGVGQTIDQTAPLKILQAWIRNSTTLTDTPLNLITKQDYDRYGNKASAGSPSQLFYKTPGPNTSEIAGTITLYPTPDANAVSSGALYFTGIYPIQDVTFSTENLDFPSYYFNALTWLLADELAYEYGVPLNERGMIAKKAQEHLQMALNMDIEEGSYFIQPSTQWG
jgi:hypothetical protein